MVCNYYAGSQNVQNIVMNRLSNASLQILF